MRHPIARFAVGLLAVLAAGAAAPAPLAAQSLPVLTRLNSPSITVDAGTSRLLRVQLTINGNPAPDNLIAWQILSTTAGATGPTSSLTDAAGIAGARFTFPRPGVTRILATYAQAGVPVSVDYTVTSVNPPPPPPPPPPPSETRLTLQSAGTTTLALVLGDRGGLAVVLRGAAGAPASGVPVRFAVESSPGSPGVGRSDQTVVSGADGVATAFFGFSTAGRVTIQATAADPAFVFEPASIQFTVDVDSLGTLTPGRRTWRSAGEALDAICLDVFVDEQGHPRPQPRQVPLCTYMTSTLTTQAERADAIHAFSPTGLASQTGTALAGVAQQKASVQSRLSALRGGALRGAVDHLALAVDGVEISNDALAAADRDGGRLGAFTRRLDDAFARLYAGLDAGDAPATDPAAAPAAPQVSPRRERPWGFFVTGRLTRGDQSRGVEEDAFDFDTAGVTAGFDRAVAANGFLGFAVSGLRNRTDLAAGGGKLDADSLALTLYGIREGEKGYLQATATYGQSRFDQRRRLAMPVVGDLTARAEFDGDQLAADLELGRSFDGRAGSLTAFVRGSWARATIDAFAERGAVAELPGSTFGPVDFGVALDAQELDSLLAAGGLDWGKAISIPGGLVIPQLTATWSHELSGDAQQVRARFLGDTAAAASFFVFTDTPDRDWLTASAALRFQYLWGSFFVSYDHELMRDDLELRTVNAGLRFEF